MIRDWSNVVVGALDTKYCSTNEFQIVYRAINTFRLNMEVGKMWKICVLPAHRAQYSVNGLKSRDSAWVSRLTVHAQINQGNTYFWHHSG